MKKKTHSLIWIMTFLGNSTAKIKFVNAPPSDVLFGIYQDQINLTLSNLNRELENLLIKQESPKLVIYIKNGISGADSAIAIDLGAMDGWNNDLAKVIEQKAWIDITAAYNKIGIF